MQRISAVIVGIALVLAVLMSAHATNYTFTLLDYGYTCAGINNAGTMVGYYLDGKGYHGYSLTGGVYTTLDAPGASGYTVANGISNNGVIVGCYVEEHSSYGFSLTGGVYTTLGDAYPGASAINSAGTIIGSYGDAGGNWQGYSLSGTTYTSIRYPGAISTVPRAINDAGVIVGTYADASSSHGFSLSGGTYVSIDYPGAISTDATGVNNSGTIVGCYTISDTDGQHGFSLDGTTFASIDHPGAIHGWGMGTVIKGINDAGVIIGECNGDSYFLGTPGEGPTHTLALSMSGKGKGSVTSDPSGIGCGSTCSASFKEGSTVTLTAQAADEYSLFSKWSGCTTTEGNVCTVLMKTNKKVTATFNATPTYQLTVSQGHTNGGKGNITSDDLLISCGTDCKEKYVKGTTIILTAVADKGSVFKGWKPSTAPCDTAGPCTVTMDKAKSVQGIFVGDYTLKVVSKSQKVGKISGAGVVTYADASPSINCATGSTSNCSGNVPYNTPVTLTAKADAGSEFKGWTACPLPSEGKCTLTMGKAFTVTATFLPKAP